MLDPTIGEEETTVEEGETFQTLACENGLVVVSTSRGQLFLIKHTAVPFNLHIQRVEATQTGFLTRFFGSSQRAAAAAPSHSTTHVLPLSPSEFLALSSESGIVEWKLEQKIATGHHCDFHPTIRLESFEREMRALPWDLVNIRRVALTVDRRVFHAIVEGSFKGDPRLYWAVFDVASGRLLRSHWLSRFALPEQVELIGLVVCEDDTAYASFTSNGAVITMVLLGEDENFIREVDLPPREVPGVFPGMMARDMVTHGCFMIATSGIALRSRHMPKTSASPSKRARLAASADIDHVPVQNLVNHLKSHFWNSHGNPTEDIPMPPSLLQSGNNREQAIVKVAVELQRKGSDPSLAVQWHEYFVKMVQDGGLYRCLSEESKWKMFAVGQELHVASEVHDTLTHNHNHADVDWKDSLRSIDLGEWFLKIQQQEEQSGWQNAAIWHDVLDLALDAFWKFREEALQAEYDTLAEHGMIGWISHQSMQKMLRCQLSLFKTNPTATSLPVVENVVRTALFSFHQSWSAGKDDEGRREEFAKVQKNAISLLRISSDGNDETAFELCTQYEYFEGLCDIARSHERKVDAQSYALDSLFGVITGRDLLNGMTFPQFVLQYHADRKLYGHVINYGQSCTQDLSLIMERNDGLRQYRWISSIRQGHYDQATKQCLDNCEESKDIDNMQWNLSFAKLANKLVASQTSLQVKTRQLKIEKTLDLVDAQKLLLGDGNEDEYDILLSPEKLCELALTRLNDTMDTDRRVELAMIALTACTAIPDESVVFGYTSKVWSECILLNGATWTEWAHMGLGDDLENLREEALSSTVFGITLRNCREEPSLAKVTYGRHLETEVLDRAQGEENRENFTRLLRAVATPADTVTGESMVVSTF